MNRTMITQCSANRRYLIQDCHSHLPLELIGHWGIKEKVQDWNVIVESPLGQISFAGIIEQSCQIGCHRIGEEILRIQKVFVQESSAPDLIIVGLWIGIFSLQEWAGHKEIVALAVSPVKET